MIRRLVVRDLQLAWGAPARTWLPVLFFLLVAICTPFALGPAPGLLGRLAPGILWLAALLASLLPIADLYSHDHADGTLDQLATRGITTETLAVSRILAHWLAFGLPLLLALPVAATLLNLPPGRLPALAASLAIGSLGLAALANLAAALTVNARGGLAALLVVPLAVPLLIFGASTEPAAQRLLAAATLVLAAACPFGAAAALRGTRT